jgi:hypothetical protein
MAATEDRLHQVQELEELYRESPDLEPPRRDPLEVWSRRLLFGWVAVFGSILLFEPAPSDPNAAVPLWGNLLLTAFTAALVAALVGLSRQRPWGLRTSIVAGALGVAIGAACVVTDHHVGWWGAFEILAFTGLTTASWTATRSTA